MPTLAFSSSEDKLKLLELDHTDQILINYFLIKFKEILSIKVKPDQKQKYFKIIFPALEDYIRNRIIEIVSPILTLEINIAKIDKKLKSTNSKSNFIEYCIELITNEEQMKLFIFRYAAGFRLLSCIMTNTIDFALNFLTNLEKDKKMLNNKFNLNFESPLASIIFGLGDPHNFSNTVTLVEDNNGTKVIYKPRSSKAELIFNTIYRKIRSQFNDPLILSPQIIENQNYSWWGFIENKNCSSINEIKKYYNRLGIILVLLYLLRVTDINMDNIIAHKAEPVIIDAESIFNKQPKLSLKNIDLQKYWTVMSTGILPFESWTPLGKQGTDISALSGMGRKKAAHRVPIWSNWGTDKMKRGYKRPFIPESYNIPKIQNKRFKCNNYINNFMEGVDEAYNYVKNPINFKNIVSDAFNIYIPFSSRKIIRSTSNYYQLINACTHPDWAKYGFVQEIGLFKYLSLQNKSLVRYIPDEINSIRRGDIPNFERKHNNLTKFQHNYQSILAPSPKEISVQKWIMRQALAPTIIDRTSEIKPNSSVQKHALSICKAIADEILIFSLLEKNRRLLFTHSPDSGLLIECDGSIYSGYSGLSLFYLYLGYITQDSKYIQTSNEFLNSAKKQWDKIRNKSEHIGGLFSGRLSYMYACFHHALYGSLNLNFKTFLQEFTEHFSDEASNDLISGKAGILWFLCDLAEYTKNESFIGLAIKIGNFLLNSFVKYNKGIFWPDEINQGIGLTGLSHGTSGICLSLFRLGKLAGETKYIKAAFEGLRYEDNFYSIKYHNWPDLRIPIKKRKTYHQKYKMFAWCHGSPGIGLSRALFQSIIPNKK